MGDNLPSDRKNGPPKKPTRQDDVFLSTRATEFTYRHLEHMRKLQDDMKNWNPEKPKRIDNYKSPLFKQWLRLWRLSEEAEDEAIKQRYETQMANLISNIFKSCQSESEMLLTKSLQVLQLRKRGLLDAPDDGMAAVEQMSDEELLAKLKTIEGVVNTDGD